MDPKKRFAFFYFCIVIRAPLSLSAPANKVADLSYEKGELQQSMDPTLSAPTSKVADLPYEKGQVQLSVDPTLSGNCKPDNTKWIFLGLFLAALLVCLILICYFFSEKCRRRHEEYERVNGRGRPETPSSNQDQNKQEGSTQLEKMQKIIDFLEACGCRENVILDPLTAHPRLEVSEDGKQVKDLGNVLNVPNSDGRFDSHMFVLGENCFVSGKHYWEVDVDQKKNWDLGIASESICRKGKIILAPQKGYWVIGLDGRKSYWARTDPWTYLKVSGTPTKIGIFLDMLNAKLSFYDVDRKSELYTFSIPSPGKFYPFFSVGSVTEELDSCPLKILNSEEE